MQFWSKGLGRRTISLRLVNGDSVKSGDLLYVRGSTEEPVVWDYAMMLASTDLVEFVTLLRDPAIAKFLYRSPRRWHIYLALGIGGFRFLGLLIAQTVRRMFSSSQPPEPTIVIPPPSDRSARGAGAPRSGPRRRLGISADTSPDPDEFLLDDTLELDDTLDEVPADAME